MAGLLQTVIDRLTGRGEAAVTVPAMDGPLRPNTRLQDSRPLLAAARPDNLLAVDGRVYFSTGAELRVLGDDRGSSHVIATFDACITAVAADPNGALAAAVEGQGILLQDAGSTWRCLEEGQSELRNCITALRFETPGALYAAQGSARLPASQWQRSLMQRDATGSLWRIELPTGRVELLANSLAYPYGIAIDVGEQRSVVVLSESWRHRIVALQEGSHVARTKVVLDNLPGYPSRLTPTGDGGHWLCVFAPRSQLIEFVLRERAFCDRMMREIPDPDLWIAPALGSNRTYLEPLQGGAVKQMGVRKPWAPTRSYGLVLRLDDRFQIVESLHSRSDGDCHGITSCAGVATHLLSTSGGSGALLETSF